MRSALLDQLPIVPAPIHHARASELITIGRLLDTLPHASSLVHDDLVHRENGVVDSRRGRPGLAAEQVLRVGILKQLTGSSYAELEFHLADSNSYRAFCRLGVGDAPPSRSSLQRNVKRVQPSTWNTINTAVVRLARDLGIESGKKTRTDCTVVESNIHYPTDSALLWDGVRVLCRLMKRARVGFGIRYTDRRRRAKRRAREIASSKSMTAKKPLYSNLIEAADEMVREAERVVLELKAECSAKPANVALSVSLVSKLKHYIPLVHQVISQAERRVLRDESVPAKEKIVSIFEEHTDVIIKGAREVEYGHKICLTTGASSIVTAATTEQGNPVDTTLVEGMLDMHRSTFGSVPEQASYDGGFATRNNLTKLKEAGVEDVMFHKRCGMEIEEMATSKRVYKKLQAFRAGIEGNISFLKRTFGLARCTWRSWPSFGAYVQASVLACNLRIMARYAAAK